MSPPACTPKWITNFFGRYRHTSPRLAKPCWLSLRRTTPVASRYIVFPFPNNHIQLTTINFFFFPDKTLLFFFFHWTIYNLLSLLIVPTLFVKGTIERKEKEENRTLLELRARHGIILLSRSPSFPPLLQSIHR